MQFVIKKEHLLKSIQAVINAISSRTVIPILTGMKIEAKNNHIILTGSNSDISIQCRIPKMIDNEEIISNIEEGSIVLPVPHFPEIIRKLPENKVKVTTNNELITKIESGNANFILNGQNSNEYPKLPLQQNNVDFQIKKKDLKQLIKQTVFAVSTMETRPILTGVQVSLNKNELTFTATDSHRLALKKIMIDEANVEELSYVIPGKSLLELDKIIDNNEDLINVTMLDNQVLFHHEGFYFLSRLLTGNYPETDRLIPTTSETKINVNKKQLMETIERAALLADREQNNVIRLDTLQNNKIKISSHSPEIGEVKEEITIQSLEGEELNISFSARYILDSLRTIEDEQIEIDFTGAMKPFIIKVPNDPSILQLILPIRTF